MLIPALAACTYVAHSKAAGYYDSGRARDDKGDSDGAIADYTKAIEADPTFFKAYLNRGIIRQRKDDYSGAVADFTKVIELDPANLQAYMSRGTARIFTKDLDGSVEDFTKAIELDTRKAQQAVNYRNRAAVYNLQKKFDLAAADQKKADELEKQP
jgi:tetratricopeptide (TPR) repeat protein